MKNGTTYVDIREKERVKEEEDQPFAEKIEKI